MSDGSWKERDLCKLTLVYIGSHNYSYILAGTLSVARRCTTNILLALYAKMATLIILCDYLHTHLTIYLAAFSLSLYWLKLM